MPPSVQDSRQSTPFSDVLDAIEARLRADTENGFDVTGFVRTCAAPNQQLHQYVAQEGLLVRVRQPQPVPRTGGGRTSLQADRIVDVVILTQSLVDAAGEDSYAVRAHLTREEAVINLLALTPPVGEDYNLRVGILIEWTEGGADIARQIKVDQGMLLSVLSFRVRYVTPTKVYRD